MFSEPMRNFTKSQNFIMAEPVKVITFFCDFSDNSDIHNSLKNDAIDLKFGTELTFTT